MRCEAPRIANVLEEIDEMSAVNPTAPPDYMQIVQPAFKENDDIDCRYSRTMAKLECWKWLHDTWNHEKWRTSRIPKVGSSTTNRNEEDDSRIPRFLRTRLEDNKTRDV